MARLAVVHADITTLAADAIVNAAAPALLGGGGVDGAIHRAAGPDLLAECRALPLVAPYVRCPTGEARLTRGYRLPAAFVIHTVGPVWHGGTRGEPALLADCYRNSLDLAWQRELAHIAFPAISCGVLGYPHAQAVAIAVREVRAWLDHTPWPQRVTFCCYGAEMAARYRDVLG